MSLAGFNRPTLPDLIDQVESDIAAALPQIDTTLPGTPLWALGKTLAAALHQLYGHLDWVADQTNALYAADEALDGFGVIWDVVRKQATAAAGTVTVTGTNGAVIPVDTEFRIAESGLSYVATASATIASGTATVEVECAEFGERGNLDAGAELGLVSPLAGVATRATVVAMVGGSDLENNTAYRQRILARIHQAPHGGAANDYVQWALAVPGVTRAWCYPSEDDPGVVVVRFMMDDAYPDDGIPELADVNTVAAYIEARRPVTAEVFVYAPSAVAINVTISGLVPNNAETRAAVRAELREMVKRAAIPGGTLYQSQFWDAISQATGVEHFSLTTPAANVTAATGVIHILGTVTFA
jgi:uncharacterized phage protein gp47/JayE